MKQLILTATAALFAAGAAYAEGEAMGDAEAGEKTFKKCKSCHMIVDPDGNVIVKGGKTGPNLWGVVGRQAGIVEGFKYGASIVAVGEGGLVWSEDELVAYMADPKAYLREALGDDTAKSKMTFKLRSGGEDVAAFLATVSPAPEEEPAADDDAATD